MALQKTLALAALLCVALAATVQAQDSGEVTRHFFYKPKPWPKNPTTQLLILTSAGEIDGSESGNDTTAKVGNTGTFTLKLDDGLGTIAYSGIYTDVKVSTKLLNYQITVNLPAPYGGFPAGKFFLVGDGTGIQDPTFTDKAVVGGLGPYVGKLGYWTRPGGASGKYYVYFINW